MNRAQAGVARSSSVVRAADDEESRPVLFDGQITSSGPRTISAVAGVRPDAADRRHCDELPLQPKPGDEVTIAGHRVRGHRRGGGAGMAPMRRTSSIFTRRVTYWYGARSLRDSTSTSTRSGGARQFHVAPRALGAAARRQLGRPHRLHPPGRLRELRQGPSRAGASTYTSAGAHACGAISGSACPSRCTGGMPTSRRQSPPVRRLVQVRRPPGRQFPTGAPPRTGAPASRPARRRRRAVLSHSGGSGHRGRTPERNSA